jgi:hypothetical protein
MKWVNPLILQEIGASSVKSNHWAVISELCKSFGTSNFSLIWTFSCIMIIDEERINF